MKRRVLIILMTGIILFGCKNTEKKESIKEIAVVPAVVVETVVTPQAVEVEKPKVEEKKVEILNAEAQKITEDGAKIVFETDVDEIGYINGLKIDVEPKKNHFYYLTGLEKGKEQIENWLAISVIATNMLDVSTKALTRMEVIHERNGIHDLIKAFKDLGEYFHGNKDFEAKNIDLDSFIFSFLHADEETQNRIIRFQESILNKKAKNSKL